MNYKSCFVSVLLCVALASPGMAKQHGKKKADPRIAGHVYDNGNKPLAQAILKLYDCDASVGNCDKPLRGSRSLPDGSFLIATKGLREGLYTLEATMAPFYLAKAKVPVFIPQDSTKSFDFVMQMDKRDATGNLVGVSPDDAKEILAAARIEKNAQVEVLCAKILNDSQLVPIAPNKQEAPQVAQNPPSAGGNQQASASSSGGKGEYTGGNTRSGVSAYPHSSYTGDTLDGCLGGSAGNFTLTDQSGKTYQLAGDTSNLSDHVGHQVRITGTEGSEGDESASSSTNPSVSNTTPSTSSTSSGSSSAGSMGSSASRSTFNVTKVKMISSSCPSGSVN